MAQTDFSLADIKKICILRLSAIGDVCLTVPLIKTLQKNIPNAEITWVISNPAYQLVEGIENINFIVIDKPKSIKDYRKLYSQFKNKSYDVLLAIQANFRVNLLYPAIKAPIKIGFDKQRARDFQSLFTNKKIPFQKQHILDSFLSFAKSLGIKELEANGLGISNIAADWKLPISQNDLIKADEILSKCDKRLTIAINPVTSKEERNWPIENYASLINTLLSRYNCNIILTGSNSEKEKKYVESILEKIDNPESIINTCGNLSLKELAATLSKVDCLISPDTAAIHIASSFKTKVIGLYAVASSKLSGPYFSREYVIDKYPEAVNKFLNKTIEEVSWKTRVHDKRAMELIKVSDVLEKVDNCLSC